MGQRVKDGLSGTGDESCGDAASCHDKLSHLAQTTGLWGPHPPLGHWWVLQVFTSDVQSWFSFGGQLCSLRGCEGLLESPTIHLIHLGIPASTWMATNQCKLCSGDFPRILLYHLFQASLTTQEIQSVTINVTKSTPRGGDNLTLLSFLSLSFVLHTFLIVLSVFSLVHVLG